MLQLACEKDVGMGLGMETWEWRHRNGNQGMEA